MAAHCAKVTAPFVAVNHDDITHDIDDSYVWAPNQGNNNSSDDGGAALFYFECFADTEFRFELYGSAPTGSDNSFWVSVNGGN